ncbi:MAG: DUF5911 domain-containing protein, partial [bacterium]|nr:DUF5911 domain-containing protein [bacterium]
MTRIDDLALVGDLHTAALISVQGVVEWLCLPTFDSPACFASLLGEPDNGQWSLRPADPHAVPERRYIGDSLVLETTWTTQSGVARVVDFMPTHARTSLVRIVEGVSGLVAMSSELRLRFDYGHVVPWVRRTSHGIDAVAGPDRVRLSTPIKCEGRDQATV